MVVKTLAMKPGCPFSDSQACLTWYITWPLKIEETLLIIGTYLAAHSSPLIATHAGNSILIQIDALNFG